MLRLDQTAAEFRWIQDEWGMPGRYGALVSTATPRAENKLPAGISLQMVMPVLVFVAMNRLAGLRWAVAAATIWSVKVLADRRRSGHDIGLFMPIITVVVIARGAIGVATDSESVYFGLGIATKYVVAATLVGSVALGRPIAAFAAPYLLDLAPRVERHKIFRSTMSMITIVAAFYYVLSATFDVWLFQRSSVEGFVVIRFLANWPLSATAIAAIMAIAQLRLPQIPGVTSARALAEGRLAQYWPPETESPEA